MNPLVYLAGPIAGTTKYESLCWRGDVAAALEEREIETLSPMRHKEDLAMLPEIARDFNEYKDRGIFCTSRGIMDRDRADVMRCDALLVNLLGTDKPSLGTIMELAWADILRKPVVVAMEPRGNPHDLHPMIHEAIGFRVETLEEAIDAVAVVLGR